MSSTISLSGMSHASTLLSATANNGANLVSEGYQAKRVAATDVAGGGVRSQMSVDTTPGPILLSQEGTFSQASNVDLERETVSLLTSTHLYAANLAVLRAEDEAVGTLLDQKA